jgi:hypothetical protein
MPNYAPEVVVSKSTVDPTKMDHAFSEKVPAWVDGYIKAVIARNFQISQDLDNRQLNQVLQTATKELNQVLENLVNSGLVFRSGNSDFKSAGE